ncbi:hypothetical protein VTO73DRAFT_3515 [Trametes versicolor]
MPILNLDLVAHVFSFVDLHTLLATCRPSSKKHLALADKEVLRRLNAVFAWFANDVEEMRNCLRSNAAFVAGSLPLTLFAAVPFEPRTADIFVPVSRAAALILHLSSVESYSQTSQEYLPYGPPIPTDPTQDSAIVNYGPGLISVTTLRRGTTLVQVFTFADPIPFTLSVDTITLSWTTALFNFVCADYAGCAYPILTHRGRALFHLQRFLRGMPGTNSDHILNSYADRGFEFAQHPNWWFEPMTRPCPRGFNCPLQSRAFEDGGVLIIPVSARLSLPVGRRWLFGGVDESIHDN